MQMTLPIRLAPTPEQHAALIATLERFNAACNAIAQVAFCEQLPNKFALQKLVYYDIRKDFGLSSQMTIRAIAKVVEAYKRDKSIQPAFRPHGAVTYDERLMSWRGLEHVYLLAVDGRQLIACRFGEYQQARRDRMHGQADLVLIDGVFYLYATLDVPDVPMTDVQDFLGVDMGIVNIATVSDPSVPQFSGSHLNRYRNRAIRLRAKLQRKGTKAAKRRLRKRNKKEARFAKDVNHCIAKCIVVEAKRTDSGIAIEQLEGIRQRARLRRPQRTMLHSWAFAQLGTFIAYKAQALGIPFVQVDPAYSSQECSRCHHVERANRPSQRVFLCRLCDFAEHADRNAAVVIAQRGVACWAAANRPVVGETKHETSALPTSCLL
jgi:putative transposase